MVPGITTEADEMERKGQVPGEIKQFILDAILGANGRRKTKGVLA